MKFRIIAAITAATLIGSVAFAAEQSAVPAGCTGFRYNLDGLVLQISGSTIEKVRLALTQR